MWNGERDWRERIHINGTSLVVESIWKAEDRHSIANQRRRWFVSSFPTLYEKSSTSEIAPQPDEIGKLVKHSFDRAPQETARNVLSHLSELDRVHLLLALQAAANKERRIMRDTEYVNDLLRVSKSSPTHGMLTRGQIASAVEYQRMLLRFSSFSQHPPSPRQLLAVAIASGLPFLGFGFCDNLVMILAGDAVDHYFGARFGITTLASAGLGNIVADIAGVSVTQKIKEQSRKVKWAAPPRLSTLQQAMNSVRVAKYAGAAAGVTLGCILGMLPLGFFPPGFFKPENSIEP